MDKLFSYGHNAADGSYDRSTGIFIHITKLWLKMLLQEETQSFVNYNYDINDNHSINARGIYTRVQSKGRFAPVAGAFSVQCLAWAACPYRKISLRRWNTDGAGNNRRLLAMLMKLMVYIYYRMRSVGPRLGYNTD